MSSLADLPEVIGFFSYSREDDEAYEGTLSALRDAIQRELSAQLGRSRTNFRLWQDQKAIAHGKLWESEIKTAVKQAVFFIPIVTPRAVKSRYCQFEFEEFLARVHPGSGIGERGAMAQRSCSLDRRNAAVRRLATAPSSRRSYAYCPRAD